MESAAARAAKLGGSLPEAAAALAEIDRRLAELRDQAETAYTSGDLADGDRLAAEAALVEAQRPVAKFRADVLAEAGRRVAAEVRADEVRAELATAEAHLKTVSGDAQRLAADVRPAVAVAREAIKRARFAESAANVAAGEVARLRAALEGRELHREPGRSFIVMENMINKSPLLMDLAGAGDADF